METFCQRKKEKSAWLQVLPLHQNHIYTDLTSCLFGAVFCGAISWAIVFSLLQIKPNLQLSGCVFFLNSIVPFTERSVKNTRVSAGAWMLGPGSGVAWKAPTLDVCKYLIYILRPSMLVPVRPEGAPFRNELTVSWTCLNFQERQRRPTMALLIV